MNIRLTQVIQQFETSRIERVEERVHHELDSLSLTFTERASIAVAAGSRGIAGIDLILKAAVDWLKAQGTKMWQDDKDEWWCDDLSWWSSKGFICKEHKIDLIFDDKLEYRSWIPDGTKFVHW